MTYNTPFTLTPKEIEGVKRLIAIYADILDAAKEIVKSQASPRDFLNFLEAKHAQHGVCSLSYRNEIPLSENMSYYFKNRVIPYSAHWGKTPEQIFFQYEDLYIHLSDVKMYMYKSLEVRFNNLNEALILSGK